ncbi:tetratricopeptide repeat protein [Polaribacter sp.]|uniref:tetratricopeptide repeat protein n=1 Tax=Polaribacter sp. TaxID=1920175 RepID=UPI004048A709
MISEDDLIIVIAKEHYLKGKKQLQQLELKRQNSFKKLLLVASVLFAISVGSFWVFSDDNQNSKEIFAQYFNPYTNVIAPISRNDKEKSTLENAFVFYENRQYQKAIQCFDDILLSANLKEKQALNLYKAISFLSLQKTDEAILLLSDYYTVNQNFKDKYLWYLGLAYLQKNDTKNAKIIFENLAKETFNFKPKETLSILQSLQ